MEKPKADILFEVSWEVCNKVGGIYTVVKSKAARIIENYRENYYVVGPYLTDKIPGQFQEELPNEYCRHAFDELKKQGIICHFGKWLIEGMPSAILIDFQNYRQKTNEIKENLWDWYKIDSLRAPQDYDEPVTWAYTAGMLIEAMLGSFQNKKVVSHFHEWLAGAGLLYLKKNNVKTGTVFTTHATILGRTLASSNVDLYNIWDKINPLEEAYRYFTESKHLVEKACAEKCDVFTTVSEITGMEAEHLLGKKPDILLPNGLDLSKFPTFEEIAIKHRLQRDRIREFLISFFFPYYTFELKQTLIYFLAGRYEFHDKGIDIFIKALGSLNSEMKKQKSDKTISDKTISDKTISDKTISDKTIVAFIWVPALIRNIKPELLENKIFYQDIKEALTEVHDDVDKNVIYSFVSGKEINKEALFERDFLLEMKSRIARFVKKGSPPLSTHDLHDSNDGIMKCIIEAGLQNKKNDPVKIIYYPTYLSGADGLLNLSYYESMQGSHLGVFPSYYEPWGYTPLEAGALGVSSVTTDLAGFGRFFCKECSPSDFPGISVLKRLNKPDSDVVSELKDVMLKFASYTAEERIASKLQARKIVSMADWKLFVQNYIKAHNMAVEKILR